MPAVNLALHQPQGNVTLASAHGGQLAFIINLSVAAAGFAVLLALRLARGSRAEKQLGLLGSLASSSSSPSRYYQQPRVLIKSRGVSSARALHHPAMSADQGSSILPSGQDSETEKETDGEGLPWSRRRREESMEVDMSSSRAIGISMPKSLLRRPPQPPPLTPPKFATDAFSFEDRRHSTAVSTIGELDTNFFQQPNPDYTSGSDGSTGSSEPSSSSSVLPLSHTSPTTPRRRSYTKALPLGPPQPVFTLELDGSMTPFSPSSFPSSSPILPLAPHESFTSKEIDMHGEIISVMDDSGAGWRRHTRVYGGGVCLACMASSEGGFYGDKVRPEERR